MSATFSWGSNEDLCGRFIDANATELVLPRSATDADIALLAQLCKQLRALNLYGCDQITDAGLQSIAGMQQLQMLYLGDSKQITDAGLAHLTVLQQLGELYLDSCDQITDAGLLHLVGLQQLHTIGTDGTSVTEAGLAAFSAAQEKAKAVASSGAAPAAASSPPQADSKAQQQQAATAAQQAASAVASAAELEELRAKAAKAAQLEAELAALKHAPAANATATATATPAWLSSLMSKHDIQLDDTAIQALVANRIDHKVFLTLTKDDLPELGITAFVDKRKVQMLVDAANASK
jgi:hypothetical protein